jgi:hypothetical protein
MEDNRKSEDRRQDFRRAKVRREEDNDPDFLCPDVDTNPEIEVGKISNSIRAEKRLHVIQYILLALIAVMLVALGFSIADYINKG